MLADRKQEYCCPTCFLPFPFLFTLGPMPMVRCQPHLRQVFPTQLKRSGNTPAAYSEGFLLSDFKCRQADSQDCHRVTDLFFFLRAPPYLIKCSPVNWGKYSFCSVTAQVLSDCWLSDRLGLASTDVWARRKRTVSGAPMPSQLKFSSETAQNRE